jgi:hypothetical protein
LCGTTGNNNLIIITNPRMQKTKEKKLKNKYWKKKEKWKKTQKVPNKFKKKHIPNKTKIFQKIFQ